MAVLYLWGVRRLAVRGTAGPPPHAGLVVGAPAPCDLPCSALGAYDTVLFSVHMVQHIMLAMIAPFLALGAPITLLLRNLGGLGRRRWCGCCIPAGEGADLAPLGLALMIATPYLLYLTGLYPLSLQNELCARAGCTCIS